MAAFMLIVSMPIGVANAALVTTEQVIDKAGIEADRALVAAYMARQEVRRQFEEMGIDPDEAAARVNGLSDVEIQQVAARINEMPAGQASNVLVAVLGAAVLIFLVLLVTDLLGLTDIFPFVNPDKRR
jgi:hypothetical protein